MPNVLLIVTGPFLGANARANEWARVQAVEAEARVRGAERGKDLVVAGGALDFLMLTVMAQKHSKFVELRRDGYLWVDAVRGAKTWADKITERDERGDVVVSRWAATTEEFWEKRTRAEFTFFARCITQGWSGFILHLSEGTAESRTADQFLNARIFDTWQETREVRARGVEVTTLDLTFPTQFIDVSRG